MPCRAARSRSGRRPDPVGAPIFYRDVPLMPSEGEKGVIKPLDQKLVPLIAWRLRNVAETSSRVVMDGHPLLCELPLRFAATARPWGWTSTARNNNKGLYALFPDPAASGDPRRERRRVEHLPGQARRQAPRGLHVAGLPGRTVRRHHHQRPRAAARPTTSAARHPTTCGRTTTSRTSRTTASCRSSTRRAGSWPGTARPPASSSRCPAPTTRATCTPTPSGAPTGEQLVFARAEARDAYPQGWKLAERANDPNETPIRYDLYRIPFDGGRGGEAVPIAGAS